MKTNNLVGGLLQETTVDGRPYFKMKLEDKEYLVISNGFKQTENDADFLIFKGNPLLEQLESANDLIAQIAKKTEVVCNMDFD